MEAWHPEQDRTTVRWHPDTAPKHGYVVERAPPGERDQFHWLCPLSDHGIKKAPGDAREDATGRSNHHNARMAHREQVHRATMPTAS